LALPATVLSIARRSLYAARFIGQPENFLPLRNLEVEWIPVGETRCQERLGCLWCGAAAAPTAMRGPLGPLVIEPCISNVDFHNLRPAC
jgi:hypothetical protein